MLPVEKKNWRFPRDGLQLNALDRLQPVVADGMTDWKFLKWAPRGSF